MPSREIALSFLGIFLLDERFDSGEIKRINFLRAEIDGE